MNIAYSRYLQNALEHSTLTDEEKQGAHAFLKFLSTYKPTGLNFREPDFYGYGDAFGQYGITYFDKQTLEDYGIDPDELDSMSSSMQLAKRFQLDKMLWPGMAVQFELCGPGIQSNRLKLPAQRPFVFAVWKDHHKIDRDQWPTGMPNLAVPELDENEWALTGSVDDMIAKVDGLRGNVTKDCLDEGIVWHLHEDQQLSEGLADELGANRCFKIINNKYLTKNGL